MSATLGALLRLVEPDWSITLVERLDAAAAESSDPWNNAGTGHSALCELNYTPEKPDGTIEIAKAINVNEQFQVTRQFWAYAHENGILTDVRSFLNPMPHVSFVQGADNVDYLRRRRDTLVRNPLFASMEFIDGADEFARRLPLMAAGRDFSDPVGLNWTEDGTDVDFGSLSKQLLGFGTDTRNEHPVRPRGARPAPGVRRQLDGQGRQPAHRREAQAAKQIRLRRRRRRRAAAAAEVRHQRGQGLRRIPGQRRVAAHQQAGADRRAITPRSTACRRWAPRRCPCRTWTPG